MIALLEWAAGGACLGLWAGAFAYIRAWSR